MRMVLVIGLAMLIASQALWDVRRRREPQLIGTWVACEPPGARLTAHVLTPSGIQALPLGRAYQILALPRQGLQWLELDAPGYLTLKIPKQELALDKRNPGSGSLNLTPRWFWIPLAQTPGYVLALLGGLALAGEQLRERKRQRLLDQSFAQGKALPGQRIGPYEIAGALGRGGMATVYEAFLLDEHRERRALKLLHAPGGGERFLREARLSLQLRHPNLVAFYDYGEHEARAYLVMEKVEGKTLDQAGLNLPARLECLSQVCQGLQALHDLGIVHRDLKPANIMVSGSKALLMDFGIARSLQDPQLTLASQAVGTPGYMAPEQILGQEPDPAADLYSLGVVLYEACCGKLPYQAESSFELLSKQLEQEPAPLQGPPVELCQLVMALLSRDPAARPGPPSMLAIRLREWSQRVETL